MALSILRGLRQLQHVGIAAPALTRLLPQLWSLGAQKAATTGLQHVPLQSPARWHSSGAENPKRKALANQLLYRSRQRGFLELDLLVGMWAEQHIPSMTTEQLLQLAEVLDQENPDLFKWLTGQLPPSEQMEANWAFKALQQHVAAMLEENRHQSAATAGGKEWLRGWDDWKEEGPAPGPGVSSEAAQ